VPVIINYFQFAGCRFRMTNAKALRLCQTATEAAMSVSPHFIVRSRSLKRRSDVGGVPGRAAVRRLVVQSMTTLTPLTIDGTVAAGRSALSSGSEIVAYHRCSDEECRGSGQKSGRG